MDAVTEDRDEIVQVHTYGYAVRGTGTLERGNVGVLRDPLPIVSVSLSDFATAAAAGPMGSSPPHKRLFPACC